MPVAPETRVTESRNMPPLHISSSSANPDVIRSVVEPAVRSVPARVMTTMPCPGRMVKGNSPVRWSIPRIFSTSMVRRRDSSCSTFRRTRTLSQTNSSTPKRAISPYSWIRSLVRTAVTPKARRPSATRASSRRTPWGSVKRVNTAPTESMATRLAPVVLTACSIRASRPRKS